MIYQANQLAIHPAQDVRSLICLGAVDNHAGH